MRTDSPKADYGCLRRGLICGRGFCGGRNPDNGDSAERTAGSLGDRGRNERNEDNRARAFGKEVEEKNALYHIEIGTRPINRQHKHNERGIDYRGGRSGNRSRNHFGTLTVAFQFGIGKTFGKKRIADGFVGKTTYKPENPENGHSYAGARKHRAERIKEFRNLRKIELRNKRRKPENTPTRRASQTFLLKRIRTATVEIVTIANLIGKTIERRLSILKAMKTTAKNTP